MGRVRRAIPNGLLCGRVFACGAVKSGSTLGVYATLRTATRNLILYHNDLIHDVSTSAPAKVTCFRGYGQTVRFERALNKDLMPYIGDFLEVGYTRAGAIPARSCHF